MEETEQEAAEEGVSDSVAATATTTTATRVPESSSPRPAGRKRRKLRKGTFSCTECKRRKVKCHFEPGTKSEDGACVSCSRHGTRCVGQEYADSSSSAATLSPSQSSPPDPTNQQKYHEVGRRLAEVELLVNSLVHGRLKDGNGANTTSQARTGQKGEDAADLLDREIDVVLNHGRKNRFVLGQRMGLGAKENSALRTYGDAGDIPQPNDNQLVRPPTTQVQQNLRQVEESLVRAGFVYPQFSRLAPGPLEFHALNRQLRSILPSTTDAFRIMNRGALFILQRYRHCLHEKQSYTAAHAFVHHHRGDPSNCHPIQLARELMQLAVCLRMMNDDEYNLSELGLSGVSPPEAADKYFEIACTLVTSQDMLVASVDGLESLMLQAFYLVNVGSLRSGWLCLRRALGIAQLMGLPPIRWDARQMPLQYVYSRLLFSERFISLMLGMPSSVGGETSSTHVVVPAPSTNESVFLQLEHRHAKIIARIIARNERLNRPDAPCRRGQQVFYDDFWETRDIDYAFEQAAHMLPAQWWAPPDLEQPLLSWNQRIEAITRLMSQAKHFHLLVLLHLPYLTERRPGPEVATAEVPPRGEEADEDGEGAMPTRGAKSRPPVRKETAETTESRGQGRGRGGREYPTTRSHSPMAALYPLASTPEGALPAETIVPNISPAQPPSSAPSSGSSGPFPPSATTAASTVHFDTTYSKMSAMAAAREVLTRFMTFRKSEHVLSKSCALDYEAFASAMALMLAHLDGHTRRGRSSGVHHQRPTDLLLVEHTITRLDELSRMNREIESGSGAALLRRLLAVEEEAAASARAMDAGGRDGGGVRFEVWTEEGTLGKGDGRMTGGGEADLGIEQTLRVPYFGTVHIKKTVQRGGVSFAVL